MNATTTRLETVRTAPAPQHRSRVVTAARVLLVGWPMATLMPWAILASSFVINVVVYLLLSDQDRQQGGTGALSTIYIVVFIGSVQTLTQFLPFSLGLSITRRDFYLAATAIGIGMATVDGVLMTMLDRVESATGGWGIDLRFFGVPFMVDSNPLLQVLVYATPLVLFTALGLGFGAVLKRWGVVGIYVLVIAVLAVAALVVVVLTLQDGWGATGAWFAGRSPFELFVLVPAVATVPVLAAGYAVARRATP